MRVAQAPPDHKELRSRVADASEKLRALPLPDEALAVREVACVALAALSVVLLSDCDPTPGRTVAPLLEAEVAHIVQLVADASSPASPGEGGGSRRRGWRSR